MAGGNGNDNGGNGADATPAVRTVLPVLGEVDGRTRPAVAYKSILEAVIADLGGRDRLSRLEVEIACRVAGLGVLAAQLEAQVIGGATVDVERLVTIANAQGRAAQRLGLRRRLKDITPTLSDYLAGHAQGAAE